MSVKYEVVKNYLSNSQTAYMARVVDEKVYSRDDFIELVLLVDPSLVRGQVEAQLSAIEQAFSKIIEEGAGLSLNIFKLSFSIQGTFTNPDDVFDRANQQLILHLNPSQSSNALLPKVHLEKVYSTGKDPSIISIVDARTQSVNKLISSGGGFTCNAIKAKILPNTQKDNSEGAYFISKADGSEHKASTIIKNTATEIIAEAPKLAAGTYSFVIRTYYSGGNAPVKTLKTLTLKNILTVS